MAKANINSKKLNNIRDIEEYGAVGDGSTDNRAFFRTAIEEDGIVHIPPGEFVIEVPDGANALPVPNITMFTGEGKGVSIIKFKYSQTSGVARNCFSITGRLALFNLSVVIENAGTDITPMFRGSGLSNLRIENCELNGGMTDDGSSATADSYGIYVPATGTQEDITVVGNDIHSFNWFFVKDNDDTSTQTRMKYLRNRFYNHYRTPILLNSPAGELNDCEIAFNTFEGGRGIALGLANCFHIGVSGSQVNIHDNVMKGAVEYAMHFEEYIYDSAAVNNRILIHSTGTGGIRFLVNNNGDGSTWVWPTKVLISQNSIEYLGTAKASETRGISVINDGDSTITDAEEILVSLNRVTGVERAYSSHGNLNKGVLFLDNYAQNCAEAGRTTESQHAMTGLTAKDCDVGVVASSGGTFINPTFINVTTPMTASGRLGVLVNPRFVFSPTTVGAASTTDFTVFPLTAQGRVSGRIVGYQICDNTTDSVYANWSAEWDGSTATLTAVQDRSPGGTNVTFVNSGGNLLARLTSTSARSDVKVTVHVHGDMMLGA